MFHRCKNKAEAKKLYYKLSLRLHPDTGGEDYLMVLLTETYEKITKDFDEKISDQKKQEKKLYEKVDEDIHEGDERLNLFKDIFSYSKKHPKFKTEFLESVLEYLQEKGYVTAAHYNCFVKTYYQFRMNEQND